MRDCWPHPSLHVDLRHGIAVVGQAFHERTVELVELVPNRAIHGQRCTPCPSVLRFTLHSGDEHTERCERGTKLLWISDADQVVDCEIIALLTKNLYQSRASHT